MRIDVLTIFPSIFDSFLSHSLLAKAIEKKIVDIRIHDLRRWSKDRHGKVDGGAFGGGAGMVMSPQPIADALGELKKESRAKTVLFTPRGKPLNQKRVKELARLDRIILVCGRYEGIDERIAEHFVDEEISMGDYILNGGEVAAMSLVESVFRILPGAIGSAESLDSESFDEFLLEYPQYTRPEEFGNYKVPEVLLSGHHENIRKWRLEKALEKTADVRPDLLLKSKFASRHHRIKKFSTALVHHPVTGKSGGNITASVTTLDVHDMARIGKTYGAQKVYIITPVEEQRLLVERIQKHWTTEKTLKEMDGSRAVALSILCPAASVDAMLEDVGKRSKKVKILATSARQADDSISPHKFLQIADEADEWIILFGAAYGIAPELFMRADYRLSPIKGGGEFNHLPVRAASAIILDRLLGS
ncbi:MAG: tRNA (guanine-N(1)-)-methyltransferase [bacterium]|nr:MAG: tRNA (guanine-N(1)-)-methyltransferase [bacterium]